jgi:hypothetical protein
MVRLLILRSHSVTFLTVDKRFQKSVSFGPYYMAGGKLVKFFSLDRHRWSLLVAFCPPVVIASTGAVTSRCRKRFPAWFFLQVPKLLASGPQPDLLWADWPR